MSWKDRTYARLVAEYLDALVLRDRKRGDRARQVAADDPDIADIVDLTRELRGVRLRMPSGLIEGPPPWERPGATLPEADGVDRSEAGLATAEKSYSHLRASRQAIAQTLAVTRRRFVWVPASLATAAICLAIIFWRQPTLTATEVIERVRVSERALLDQPLIVHRVLSLEERRLPERTLVSRRRIELWRRPSTVPSEPSSAIAARRLFDERQQLLAGEWTTTDGARTVYQRGAEPVRTAADRAPAPNAAAISLESLWMTDLSADAFLTFVNAGNGSRSVDQRTLSLERAGTNYRIQYDVQQLDADRRAAVRTATLVVRETDFRPIEQTVVIERRDSSREYRLSEEQFEHVAPENVSATVFAPERELLPSEPATIVAETPRAVVRPAPVAPTTDVAILDRLEMAAWYRLHALGLAFEDEAAVIRKNAGAISVSLTTPSVTRNEAAMAGLAPLLERSAGLLTVDARVTEASSVASVDEQTIVRTPLYSLLLARLSPSSDAATIASEYVRWILQRLNRIRQLHEALREFVDRWPVDRALRLDADAISQWQTIVRDHVSNITDEGRSIHTGLSSLLKEGELPAQREPLLIEVMSDVQPAIDEFAAQVKASEQALEKACTPVVDGKPADGEAVRRLLNRLAALESGRQFAGPWAYPR